MPAIRHLEKLKSDAYFKDGALPCIVREMREAPSGYEMWAMVASNELYDVRLDMAFPPASALADDGAEKAEAESEGEPPAPRRPPVEWRELCVEKTLPGFEIPPRPQPPKF